MRISRYEIFSAKAKLSEPIADATHTLTEISFLVLRLHTDNGNMGESYLLSFQYSPNAIVGALKDQGDLLIGEGAVEILGHEPSGRANAANGGAVLWAGPRVSQGVAGQGQEGRSESQYILDNHTAKTRRVEAVPCQHGKVSVSASILCTLLSGECIQRLPQSRA